MVSLGLYDSHNQWKLAAKFRNIDFGIGTVPAWDLAVTVQCLCKVILERGLGGFKKLSICGEYTDDIAAQPGIRRGRIKSSREFPIWCGIRLRAKE